MCMVKLLPLLLIIALASVALTQSKPRPSSSQPAPLFESELWPGEGVPKFSAKSDYLLLYSLPDSHLSPARKWKVAPGTPLRYSATRLITRKAGIIEVIRASEIQARPLGEIKHLSGDRYYSGDAALRKLSLRRGERVQYLQYRAEGSCLIRRGKIVYELEECGFDQRGPLRLSVEPLVEWWVRLQRARESPGGWIQISEQAVNFLPREF